MVKRVLILVVDGILVVAFSPLWAAAALAYTAVWFARFGWELAEQVIEEL